ncbi:MAG: polyprenyl synthetase family protein [Chloroflexi bacterium]|nr:polyprenyl synthetase family protein [Chloroflexota bacterium]MBU1746481.1 polyprenyl synthetase family protein [Chloroflexota bacterium]
MQSILSPIQDDLAQVEARLLAETRLPYPHLGDVLSRLFQAGGKRVRPALALLAAHAVADGAFDPDQTIQFATGTELLHTATLVHDDMVDQSELRRGQSTLNTVLPSGLVVLIGDYLFARSAMLGSGVENVTLMTLFARTLETICTGELRQAFSNRDWRQSKEAYYQKIYSKTAALFVLATEGGAMLVQAPLDTQQALREYGHKLGLAFQIVDDILDFVGTARELGKPVGSDLRQGTVTLPTLYYLTEAPADNPVHAYLDQGIDAPEDQRQRQLTAALTAITGSPAIESSYREAETLAREAQAALHILPASPYRGSLHDLAEYVVRRRT